MKTDLFSIWENPYRKIFSWHVQMVNYVAHFNTKEEAERFVEATRKARERETKSIK
jgi:hypothetical protein